MALIKRDLFLATTGKDGFFSFYGDLVADSSPYRTTIIKGSSGSGKSTTLMAIASAMLKKGYSVDVIRCASDPASLDGVLCKEIGVAIIDGTAPHTTDPKFPGARDSVIDLYSCLDGSALAAKLHELMTLSNKASTLRSRAARFVRAASEILGDRVSAASSALQKERLRSYAEGLASRLFPKKHQSGSVQRAFASAVTPDGVTDYLPSLARHYKNSILFHDPYGAAGALVLDILLQRAVSMGYSVTLLMDPLFPERPEGILVQETSTALVLSSAISERSGCSRGVHLQRFYEPSALPFGPGYLNFCRKSALALLAESSELMDEAREQHLALEEIYKAAMDFSDLQSRRQQLLESMGLAELAD